MNEAVGGIPCPAYSQAWTVSRKIGEAFSGSGSIEAYNPLEMEPLGGEAKRNLPERVGRLNSDASREIVPQT